VNEGERFYGFLAEFPNATALLQAARAAHAAGYVRIDAYSPMHVEGLAEALGFVKDRISLLALLGGLVGGVSTYALQWYSVSSAYPLNVGGRTPVWPGLIPATFEMTILGAALAVFFGMLFADGLPRLNHPTFNVPDFALASRDGFFLCLPTLDSGVDTREARRFLEQLQPLKVMEITESDAQ